MQHLLVQYGVGVAGWLKSKFGINEVIANIMLNWIAFYLSNFVLMTSWLKVPNSETSVPIKDSAKNKHRLVKRFSWSCD